jgi:uncharacterized protein YukE
MIRINDSQKFESIILEMETSFNNISNIFEKVNNNINSIDSQDIWAGKAKDEFFIKYKQLSGNYETISNSLTKYENFMKTTLNNYINFENKTRNDLNNGASNLDVNS